MTENKIIIVLLALTAVLLVDVIINRKKLVRQDQKAKERNYCAQYHALKADISITDDIDKIPDLSNQVLDLYNQSKDCPGAADDMQRLFELIDRKEKNLYNELSTAKA